MHKKDEPVTGNQNFQPTLYQLPRQLLKCLLSGIWEIFKIAVWLLIQSIELGVWVASELTQFLKHIRHQCQRAIQVNRKAVLTWPIKQILLGIWSIIVVFFWLLIQLIELGFWVLSNLHRVLSPSSPVPEQDAEEKFLPPSVKLRRKMMKEHSSRKETPPG